MSKRTRAVLQWHINTMKYIYVIECLLPLWLLLIHFCFIPNDNSISFYHFLILTKCNSRKTFNTPLFKKITHKYFHSEIFRWLRRPLYKFSFSLKTHLDHFLSVTAHHKTYRGWGVIIARSTREACCREVRREGTGRVRTRRPPVCLTS